jgi:Zn2+/Cd2+-exporting ATPase
MSANTIETRFRIDGMDCAACAKKIDTAIRRLPGVTEVAVSVGQGTMRVAHSDAAGLPHTIAEQVKRLGYSATANAGANATESASAHDHDHNHDHAPADAPWWRRHRNAVFTLSSMAAIALAYATALWMPTAAPLAFLLALLIGLGPIAWRALMAARAGTPFSIEMLMTVAAIGAVILRATEEAAAVVVLFQIGEWLEGLAARRARASIQALTNLLPQTAMVERDGRFVAMPASALTVGMVLQVRAGERVAADGTILTGSSSIDESPVTGESVPRDKQPGDSVYAGTINGAANLTVSVTASAENNTLARVVALVEQAQESKAPTERFIERFSRLYTPAVVGVALAVAVLPPLLLPGAEWSAWAYKALAVLLIGCPCALVISTPAAITAALAAGARAGLLIKGGAILERAGALTAIAFDKTGTLTLGRPQVAEIVSLTEPAAAVLALAAGLEQGTSHPLARAILEHAEQQALSPAVVETITTLAGSGVTGLSAGAPVALLSLRAATAQGTLDETAQAQMAALGDAGHSVVVVVRAGHAIGAIALRDQLRPDAPAALRTLRALNLRVLMLTGDTVRAANAIGQALDLEVRAELLPADKAAAVTALRAEGLVVAKVGDGINDAPALAAADIGIAMGGGTDIALETADAALLHSRISDVAALITLSRRTLSNIRQNITLALGLKAVFLVTTVLGITGLWPAILADTGATVLVTLNALRLLGWRAPRFS